MLELKDVKKTYHVGDIETKALDGVSVAFREKEFVAILGTSGSGKTTCLNIIGGVDHYNNPTRESASSAFWCRSWAGTFERVMPSSTFATILRWEIKL